MKYFRIRLKYLVTFCVMGIASFFMWESKISDEVWMKTVLGCLGAILIGFSVKTLVEIIKAWKGNGG